MLPQRDSPTALGPVGPAMSKPRGMNSWEFSQPENKIKSLVQDQESGSWCQQFGLNNADDGHRYIEHDLESHIHVPDHDNLANDVEVSEERESVKSIKNHVDKATHSLMYTNIWYTNRPMFPTKAIMFVVMCSDRRRADPTWINGNLDKMHYCQILPRKSSCSQQQLHKEELGRSTRRCPPHRCPRWCSSSGTRLRPLGF